MDQKPLTSAFLKAKDPVPNRQRHQLAFISEFATDVAHVPGLENVIADILSRQFHDEEPTAIVNAIVHTLADVDLADLAEQQRPAHEEPPSSLKKEEALFARVDRTVLCDTSLGRHLVLVPESWRCQIFDAIHGLSPPSGKATLAIVSKSCAWRNMRSNILNWARQCQACAASKVTVHLRPEVQPIPVPTARFGHVHVDIVGPFLPDQGFRQFTFGAWKTTLSRLGVATTTTTSYHPQANGLVERFHHTLKNALCCAVHTNKSWTRSLPWLMLGLWNLPKLDTAASTAEAVFGTPLRVPGLCFQEGKSCKRSATEELELARTNARAFLPEALDLRHSSHPRSCQSL